MIVLALAVYMTESVLSEHYFEEATAFSLTKFFRTVETRLPYCRIAYLTPQEMCATNQETSHSPHLRRAIASGSVINRRLMRDWSG